MSNSNQEEDVTIGEVTIQFTADDSAGKKEVAKMQKAVEKQVREIESANAVIESYTLDGFDQRLSWGGESDE